jgi:hypothetical protein
MITFHAYVKTLFLIASIVFLASACDGDSASAKFVELEPADAIPLSWHDENTIIIGHHEAIYLYDLSKRMIVSKVADAYDSSNFDQGNCFSKNAGLFAVAPPKFEKTNGTAITTVATKQRFRYISDWKKPDQYKDLEFAIWWNTNPIDCIEVPSIFRLPSGGFYAARFS